MPREPGAAQPAVAADRPATGEPRSSGACGRPLNRRSLGGPMSVRMKCPDCGRLARWSQRWRWSGVLGQRRVAPCPFCGASLRISASMRVVNLAVICSLLMQVADYTILRRVDASAGSVSVRGALLMIRMGLLVVLVVAFSRTRLERHPTSTVTP